MRIVVFGLSVTSSWGNGHALLWRALIRALHAEGHRVTFFERDVPYYAEHRDLYALPGGKLVLYREWDDRAARFAIGEADVAVVTSYCPDALAAGRVIRDTPARLSCFYDLDSPVTLARLAAGETVDHVGPEGYAPFDLVLSYAGGPTLAALRQVLGARRVVPLYGSVDPDAHRPGRAAPQYAADLSYLGTFASDRQAALDRLFLAPARASSEPSATRISSPGVKTASIPSQRSVRIGAPQAAASNRRPDGHQPLLAMASRVTFSVSRDAA